MSADNPATKVKELVLFVANRCSSHGLFGKIKLNKILFFSDVDAYLSHGRSITGANYIKREFGPVPEHMDQHVRDLVAAKDAVVVERDMPDMTQQKRVVPLRKPNLSAFTAEDISIVSEVIEWMRPMSATEISDLSHQSVGWDVARMGEIIPLSTAIIPETPIPFTAKEHQTGKRLAAKLAEQGRESLQAQAMTDPAGIPALIDAIRQGPLDLHHVR